MRPHRISVVIPSFNQGEFLDSALRSVLDQGYPNLEVIVMDGGSTDSSVDVIRSHEARIDHWESRPDGGQTDALINGFRRSTGEIMCWLNSDDLMVDGCLDDVNDFFSRNRDAEAVYGDAQWISRDGRLLRTQNEIPFSRFIWMYTYNYIPGMSMYWRRALYERVGGLDRAFDLAMDADLWSRFAEVTQIHHMPRIWSRMRFYEDQKNRRLRAKSNEEDLVIRKRYWGQATPPSLLRLRQLAALTARILWKAGTGCYAINYRRYMDRD